MSQSSEVFCCLSIGYLLKASYKIDYVTPGVASGKAMPEIFGKADNKGIGVVATVHGARAKESVSAFFKLRHHAFSLKYCQDRDAALEMSKIEMVRDHLDISAFVELIGCQGDPTL